MSRAPDTGHPGPPVPTGTSGRTGPLRGAIFDVDGVLLASPHERAWREALNELMATEWRAVAAVLNYRPERFTSAVYQAVVAGKPRLSGARAALEHFGVPDAERRALEYAVRKQRRLEELIEAGAFAAYPDGVRLVLALRARGLRLAAASSSKNAAPLLELTRVDSPSEQRNGGEASLSGATLLDLFDTCVCGRDLPQGKPHPAIFLLAAEELGLPPAACLVVEDAPAGVQAAKAAGMRALGIARVGDAALLEAAGADLVVNSLDEVAPDALVEGRLARNLNTTAHRDNGE